MGPGPGEKPRSREKMREVYFRFSDLCLRRYVNTSEGEQPTEDRVWKIPPPKSGLLLSWNVKTRLCSPVPTLGGLQKEPLLLLLLLL